MKLEDLEALEKAATPGPWWDSGLMVESSHVVIAATSNCLADRCQEECEANTAFIAAALLGWMQAKKGVI